MDGLGRSLHGAGASSASGIGLNPDTSLQFHLPVRMGTRFPPRGSEVAALVSGLRTKTELASMLLSLERAIKKEVSAVRSDLLQVLVRVEESELRLDRHAAAIRVLQFTTCNLSIEVARPLSSTSLRTWTSFAWI